MGAGGERCGEMRVWENYLEERELRRMLAVDEEIILVVNGNGGARLGSGLSFRGT